MQASNCFLHVTEFGVFNKICFNIEIFSGYLIVSPQKIRPDQDFRLFITIYKMYHHECDVRAVLSRDAVEYATESITFTHTGTKEMLLKVWYL